MDEIDWDELPEDVAAVCVNCDQYMFEGETAFFAIVGDTVAAFCEDCWTLADLSDLGVFHNC